MIFRPHFFHFYIHLIGLFLLFQTCVFLRAENPSLFVPTNFQNVYFPEISLEEDSFLDETFQTISETSENQIENFENLRNFLLHKSRKFTTKSVVLKDGLQNTSNSLNLIWLEKESGNICIRKTVSEEIRSFLQTLPKEILLAWRQFIDVYIEKILSSEFKSPFTLSSARLRQIIQENPLSSYEAEIWEVLAQLECQNGQFLQANICWQTEFQLRSNPIDETRKLFFLKELPSLEIIKRRINLTQKELENNSIRTNVQHNWRVTMTQIFSPSGEIVFEDLLPEDQRGSLFPSRKRDTQLEAKETFELSSISSDGKFLAARLGTMISLWPEAELETRPQAYLVVLDLSRGGQLLWTAVPTSQQTIFIGNPLIDMENLYIPVLRLGNPAQISLNIYSLMDGLLKEQIPLFSANISEMKNFSSIFLPIYWTNTKNIQVGNSESGVQVTIPISLEFSCH